MKLQAKATARLCFVSGLCALCALATFVFFEGYHHWAGGRRGTPVGGLALAFLGLFLLSPVLLIAGAGLAIARRGRVLLGALQLHAALVSGAIAVSWATHSPGHSSFGDSLSAIMLAALTVMTLAEIAAVWVVSHLLHRSMIWPYGGVTFALLAGWVLGVLLWSERLPPRVIAAAEITAAGRPYCIEAVGRPISHARYLTGLHMTAFSDGGYAWHFHALLVVENGPGRSFFNWSYRSATFRPVTDSARMSMRLDDSPRCNPIPSFASRL